MFARTRVSHVLFTVMLAVSMLSWAGQPATESAQATPGNAVAMSTVVKGAPASSVVTLVTGDRILIQGDSYQVLDNPARREITFLSYRHEGHLNVIPSDAVGLVGSKLDSKLFDVTALAEMGYAGGRDLGLIIKHGKGTKGAARSAVAKVGGAVAAELPSIDALVVKEKAGRAGSLWNELTTGNARGRNLRPGVAKITLDSIMHTTLDQSVPQVGAPTAWAAGFDGTGVKVGVVDSGIDTTHPDLDGKVLASANFTEEAPEDLVGHGTHVASILAGTGAASGGQFRGVAPGADLVSAKVCQLPNTCPFSSILQGMQWAADQDVDVINMSLGGPDTAGLDPIEEMVNSLTVSHGILFVVAAGNTPTPPVPLYSVNSPSTADAALSVGAVHPGDGLAYFSNRGPRVGDTALKPDMTAPGMSIMAARSSFSRIPGGQYVEFNGTSMASPHVAGAAAILAQRHPAWSPAQLKSALMGSAYQPTPQIPIFDQGAGRLNVATGYNMFVLADPPSISLGRAVGPHEDDPVINRTITYTNTDTSNGVGLTVSLNTQAPGGGPAPGGMFTLSTTSLSIPPGGTASVTLTTTTSVPAPDGFYGGWVVATGQAGGVRVSTPFAVDRSVPGRELTFHHLNRAGDFTTGYTTVLLPITPGKPIYPITSTAFSGPSGPRTEFIEDGDYFVITTIPEESTGFVDHSILFQPKLTVNASTPANIDLLAAQAQPVTITVPNPSAVTGLTEIGVGYLTQPQFGANFTSLGQVYTKQTGPANTVYPGLVTKVQRTSYVPAAGRTDSRNAPAIYNLAWFVDQQFPTGFTRNVTTGQLAERSVSYGRNVPGSLGTKWLIPQPSGTLFNANFTTFMTIFDLPITRTEYYSTNNVRWSGLFFERVFPGGLETLVGSQESALTGYLAGSTGTETWNNPVYGPALGSLFRPEDWVVRRGNDILFLPPMLGDNQGHSGHAWTLFTPLPGLEGQAVLKRDGVVVATTELPYDPLLPRPQATVPAQWSPYTLEATLTRGAPVDLATSVSAVWSFYSSSVDPNAVLRLSLWSVLFKPNLDADNAAPAGSFAIPLTAVAQPGSPVAGMNTITVQYSSDDGATWQNATVAGSGPNRTATVTNPAAGYVSLRATATDWAGFSVTQTTIRAYRIAS